MPSRMTDEELKQWVQETPPETWRGDELEQLRERVRVSPELQQTLLSQLQFESELNAAFCEVRLSVDAIVSEAASAQGSSAWPLTLGLGGLLLCVGAAFFALNVDGEPVRPAAAPQATVEVQDAKAPREKSRKPAPAKPVELDVDEDTFSSPSDLVEGAGTGPPI